MTIATIHALPSCSSSRIFELRREAKDVGARFIPSSISKPKAKPITTPPCGGDAA